MPTRGRFFVTIFAAEISSETCKTAFIVLVESTGSLPQENNKRLLSKTTVTLIVLKNIHWFHKSDGSQLFSVSYN